MNIFFLDENPKIAAQMHFDKHVIKMILESAQLLCTAHRKIDGIEYIDTSSGRKIKRWKLQNIELENILYKATHVNHPTSIWVCENKQNYQWTFKLFHYLIKEYSYRFNKEHKCKNLLKHLINSPKNTPNSFEKTIIPQVMEKQYIIPNNPVKGYQNLYKYGKKHLFKYTKRKQPNWLIHSSISS
jgi:uncharacterized ubiquitin-like protein YukD